ncbi:MAG: Hsp33 family molecular chaperone HslO [Bacilli bacterium]|nr:Hsp33 family molecular chaperone HslO [Bacilli bacterium]MDY6430828.1 Hsp33 family molecular chaperone HslO [Bacilli bacterium]
MIQKKQYFKKSLFLTYVDISKEDLSPISYGKNFELCASLFALAIILDQEKNDLAITINLSNKEDKISVFLSNERFTGYTLNPYKVFDLENSFIEIITTQGKEKSTHYIDIINNDLFGSIRNDFKKDNNLVEAFFMAKNEKEGIRVFKFERFPSSELNENESNTVLNEKLSLEEYVSLLNLKLSLDHEYKISCSCSKNHFVKVLKSLPKDKVKEIFQNDETIEINCGYCNKKYQININEI